MPHMMHKRCSCQLMFSLAKLTLTAAFLNDLERECTPIVILVKIREPVGCDQLTDLRFCIHGIE